MRSLHPYLIFFICILCGCGGNDGSEQLKATGGKNYGGVFSWNESGDLRSIFPPNMTQASAHRVVGSVYEGLVRFNPKDLSVEPAIAESWEMLDNGRVFRFKLRKGVRFHDDPCFNDGVGRMLTAEDVLSSYSFLCSQNELNQMFWLFQDRVLGANTAYATSAKKNGKPQPVKGIQAIDEATIQIELAAPYPAFLQILAHQGCWIYPQEFFDHYGEDVNSHAVGTGPFLLESMKPGEVTLLRRNASYWGKDDLGNRLPFLEAVKVNFESKDVEVQEFLNGNLSILQEVPLKNKGLLEKNEDENGLVYSVQNTPSLTVQYYCFNVNQAPFDDERVRRAIAMAIDRRFIADSIMSGLAVPALNGVVPNFFKEYPEVVGLPYDPEGARKLLAEAGYENGQDFPVLSIQFSGNGFGYVEVVNAIQEMLRDNLGLRVPISTLPSDQYYDMVETGKAGFWREGWLADHPDPENFLALFYGKNAPADLTERTYLNTTRFKDQQFDSLMVLAGRTAAVEDRMKLYGKADQRFVKAAPAIPIYFTKANRLVRSDVVDLYLNGMESIDLHQVWMKPVSKTKSQ